MPNFRRYAIYHVPTEPAFFDTGSAWLGWNARTGKDVAHPALHGLPAPLSDITASPRKYGFHGTVRAPFFLAENTHLADLKSALAVFAATRGPAEVTRLSVTRVGSFLALTPDGDASTLNALCGAAVKFVEPFRAPLSAEDRARRDPDALSPRQRHYLDTYGYPYVFEEMRFHITLSGQLEPVHQARVQAIAQAHIFHVLPQPYRFESLTLLGEDAETRRFHVIQDYPLSG